MSLRPDDALSATDGVNPIVTDDMKQYINSMLTDEAKNANADLDDAEVTENHVATEVVLDEAEMDALFQAQDQSSEAKQTVDADAHEDAPPLVEDDGFQVVGKKGKTKKPAVEAPKKSTQSTAPSYRAHTHVTRAGEPEVRPKMPGDSRYPFCFTCSLRHDFGACKLEPSNGDESD
jgi:hypothetical protein